MECLNCQQEVKGNYCENCGQRTSTKRITMASLFENLLTGISNINRGFLYNLKALSLRPGEAIQGYLDGKRTKLFHPIQYALIGVTILTYISETYGMKLDLEAGRAMRDSDSFTFGYRYGTFIRTNLKYFWLLTIPFFSLPSSLFFSKLNLAENLTVHAFIGGHAALITACLFLLLPMRFLFNPIIYLSIFVLMIFTYRRYYTLSEAIGYSLAVLFFGLLSFILVPALFIWLIGLFQ